MESTFRAVASSSRHGTTPQKRPRPYRRCTAWRRGSSRWCASSTQGICSWGICRTVAHARRVPRDPRRRPRNAATTPTSAHHRNDDRAREPVQIGVDWARWSDAACAAHGWNTATAAPPTTILIKRSVRSCDHLGELTRKITSTTASSSRPRSGVRLVERYRNWRAARLAPSTSPRPAWASPASWPGRTAGSTTTRRSATPVARRPAPQAGDHLEGVRSTARCCGSDQAGPASRMVTCRLTTTSAFFRGRGDLQATFATASTMAAPIQGVDSRSA